MRRISLLAIFAFLPVAAAVWAYSPAKEGRTERSCDKLPPEDPKPQFVTKEVRGQLMMVQPDLAVLRNSLGSTSLELTRDTRVRIGSHDATIADLRPGMDVTAFYLEERYRKTATTIVVDGPVIVDAAR